MSKKDIVFRNAKTKDKAYKLPDEKGLYLYIKPNGSKFWRFKYRFAGKEKLLSIGMYGDVSLSDARDAVEEARKLLAKDIDPGLVKQSNKRIKKEATENSFEKIAREWHAKRTTSHKKSTNKKIWTTKHAERILTSLEKDIFPYIGSKPINEITAPDLLTILRRIENRGAIDTAHRAHQNCSQIFRYAIAIGKAERDIAIDLRGALEPVSQQHYATITKPEEIGTLLRAINDYQGYFPTKCALQLAPLLFVRPGELRNAEWREINFIKREWRIPAEKMKMRIEHIVPLSDQAITILQQLHPLTGNGKYLFPSVRTLSRPMSNNTLNGALRRLGYTKEEITPHGFRSMASTLLNEQGFNRDAIERQLSHGERNTVRAAYNFAEYLPERKKMMQSWAEYLDSLAATKAAELKVV